MSETASGISLLIKNQPSTSTVTEPPTATQRAEESWQPTIPAPHVAEDSLVSEGWPAAVLHRLPQDRRAAVQVAQPILHHLQSIDGLRLVEGSTPGELLIRTTEAHAGDRVLLSVSDGYLQIDGYLSADAYTRQVSRCVQRLLSQIAAPHTNIDAVRAARRRLESWLDLKEDPRNPWSLPGNLSESTIYLSRRILSWCSRRVDTPASRWLDGGLPEATQWGPGPLTFASVRGEDGSFSPIIISTEEHTAQSAAWRRLMAEDTALALPKSLTVLLGRLSIPLPTVPLAEPLAVLATWSEADAPALARRAQALLLLSLATEPKQRKGLRGLGVTNPQLEDLHQKWTDAGCPADVLPGIVTDEELPTALTALVGKPGTAMVARLEALIERRISNSEAVEKLQAHAATLCGQIASLQEESEVLEVRRTEVNATLDRLEQRVSALAPLLESTLPVAPLPTNPATLPAFRAELEARTPGISEACADRLLLALTAAADLGAPVLLVGPESAEVAAVLPDIIDGTGRHHIPVRPEWSSEADLLGQIQGDRFIPSKFTEAIQQVTASTISDERSAPGIVWLEGMDRADPSRYTPSLLAAMERDRRLALYPRAQHAAWQDAGTVTEPDGWQLNLPPGLVLLGTLEGHQELPVSLTQRSLMVRLSPPDLSAMMTIATGGRCRLLLPEISSETALDINATFPLAWANFQEALMILRPLGARPSRRLARQATACLRQAAAWAMADDNALSAHLVHLLLLDRIQSLTTTEPLAQLLDCDWLTDSLAEAIWTRIA